jgi:hypothetical protein
MDILYLDGKNNKSFDLRTNQKKANDKMEIELRNLSLNDSIS